MITEKVAYLANVLTIACADGRLSRREEGILHVIAESIGASEADIEEAKSLLMRGDYRLIPLKVTAERLQNIEDMVMVAMADGSLSGHETTPIESFTDALGLTQKEMDSIVTRAQQRLRNKEFQAAPRRTIRRRGPTPTQAPRYHPKAPKPPPTPPQPPAVPPVPPRARQPSPPKPPPLPLVPPKPPEVPKPPAMPKSYRQQPAERARPSRERQRKPRTKKAKKRQLLPAPPPTPPVQAERPRPERKPREEVRSVERKPVFVPPSTGIVVAFAGIASDALQIALREAASASKTGQYETTTTAWHYAVWPTAEIRLAARCALAAAALANHIVYVDGKQQNWDETFGFCRCALARMGADSSDGYCFGCDDEFLNIWGCRQARMDWSDSADWFTLGSFEGSDGFAFDKNAIWNMLQANLAKVQHCPFLDTARMKVALENLPDRIKARGRWRFREAQGDAKNAQTRTVNESIQGSVFSYETLVDGVAPSGDYDALRLISRTTKAIAGKPLAAACLKRGAGMW